MHQQVYIDDFHKAFIETGREANFSYEGRKALFEYLEELEQDLGETIEFDVIALCCDFTEYDSLAEIVGDYGDDWEDRIAVIIPIDGTDRYIISE